MAIDTIKATAILDGSVDTADLADNAVTTAKITDGNITGAKIGDGEVTSAKLDTNIDIAGTLDVTGVATLDDDLNVDSGTLFVDASTNRVGIGTTSPSNDFHVSKSGGSSVLRLDRTDSATTGSLYVQDANNACSISSEGGAKPINFGINGTTAATIDSSSNLQFNSGYGSVATAYGCRAWVNFNGTGTVAIRDSGNVSSITDLNVGKYRVNFSTAMPDANYAAVILSNADSGTSLGSFNNNYTGNAAERTTAKVDVASYAASFTDSAIFDVAIFR